MKNPPIPADVKAEDAIRSTLQKFGIKHDNQEELDMLIDNLLNRKDSPAEERREGEM